MAFASRPRILPPAGLLSQAALLLGLALPALVGASAAAQGTPRSVAECERLKNDLAYNQCLAMFGPAAHNIAAGSEATRRLAPGAAATLPPGPTAGGAAVEVPTVEEPALRASGRRGRYARRGGRARATFTVGTVGADSSGPRRRRSSRHRR